MPTWDPGLPPILDFLLIVLVVLNPFLIAFYNRKTSSAVDSVKKDVAVVYHVAQKAATSAASAEYEVKPNSGGSLADSQNRTETLVKSMTETVSSLAVNVESLNERVSTITQRQGVIAKDVGGIREEIRQERKERGRIDERLTTAISERKAQVAELLERNKHLEDTIPMVVVENIKKCPYRVLEKGELEV